MPKGKHIVICQSGGMLTASDDGSLSYKGGDAHAIGVDNGTRFDELKSEMADMWKYDPCSISIKYFLPNNNKRLITISSDKDVQRMLNFYEDSTTMDVYVFTGDDISNDISTMPGSRSSPTTMGEHVNPVGPLTLADHFTLGDHIIPVDHVTPVDQVTHINLMLPPDPEPIMAVDPQTAMMMNAGESGQFKLAKLWENCITGVQQQFNSVNDFRDALRKYSVARGFACTYKHNDCRRVSAKCKTEGCPWRIRASRLATTQLFIVRKLHETHTCGAGTSAANRPQASKKLVVSIMKDILRDSPTSKPKEIADEIQQDFGIELQYSQAWRGMETARKELQGSFKDSYNYLPWICEKIAETNPGSVATLTTREDMSFHGLFIAFYASLTGFRNGCRPLLFLDTMTLKSKYNSELLIAMALDGNDGIFPVAFAIVDRVNDDNWNWFLEQLNTALAVSQPITFVTDRKMGLRRSISKVFRNSFHAYCLHHLTEDLKKDLRGPHSLEVIRVIVAYLFDAAYTPAPDTYRMCVERIRNISPEACEWILQSEPRYWANSLFEGSRYNNLMGNIAEPFYNWVSALPVLPITNMIDSMRRKMMELIYTRRIDSGQWSARLTPTIGNKLQEEIAKAQSLQVIDSTGSKVEVSDGLGAINVVNVDHWDCSCGMWQVTGIPCLHAVAAVEHNNGNICDYCSKYFTTETFRLTYLDSINPLPTADMPVHKNSSPVQVHPPVLHRSPGLPKKRRIRSKGVVKRPLHCSRCKGVGHNRATCFVPPS